MQRRNFVLWPMVFALGGCAGGSLSPLREATGATAQTACNAAFVSKLEANVMVRRELHAEPGMALIDWALRYTIDRTNQSVVTKVFGGASALSVYRRGRGCTLVYGDAQRADAAIVGALPAAVLPDTSGPDMAGPDIVVPVDPRLSAAIDAAFAEPSAGAPRSTEAVVIVQHGRVIGERYADGISPRTALNSHSLAKSVVNALVGILVRDGKLDPTRTDPLVPGPRADSSQAPASIEQLLRMNAGFGFDEGPGASISSRIWYTAADTAAASAESAAQRAPVAGWGYCNRCYTLLSKRVGDATGGGPAGLQDFATRALFGPLGMRDVTLEFDQVGTLMGANAVFASARDLARFGLLYLHDGVADGRRILPPGWVAMSTAPTSGAGYGAGFWLNTTQRRMPNWPLDWGLPDVPTDAFFARGHLGQYIVMVPSHDLVIVRMGQSHRPGAERDSVGRLTAEVIRIVGRAS